MRADPLTLASSPVLVLCLNLGRTYTFHCRRKSKWASKWLGFLVNVPFWSALNLTLNQRARSSSSQQMDALARRFAETHDAEVRKQIEVFSQQQVRMTC